MHSDHSNLQIIVVDYKRMSPKNGVHQREEEECPRAAKSHIFVALRLEPHDTCSSRSRMSNTSTYRKL